VESPDKQERISRLPTGGQRSRSRMIRRVGGTVLRELPGRGNPRQDGERWTGENGEACWRGRGSSAGLGWTPDPGARRAGRQADLLRSSVVVAVPQVALGHQCTWGRRIRLGPITGASVCSNQRQTGPCRRAPWLRHAAAPAGGLPTSGVWRSSQQIVAAHAVQNHLGRPQGCRVMLHQPHECRCAGSLKQVELVRNH